jgi:hypothetical protein
MSHYTDVVVGVLHRSSGEAYFPDFYLRHSSITSQRVAACHACLLVFIDCVCAGACPSWMLVCNVYIIFA